MLSRRGHPGCPNSQGKVCGRCNAGAATTVDGDRLQYPMVRTGERGEGKFRRIGWKEACGRIAEGFSAIRARHGAQALALLYHGAGGPLLRSMLVAYKPNFAGPAYAQCKAARNVRGPTPRRRRAGVISGSCG